jgi:hypothetical protein
MSALSKGERRKEDTVMSSIWDYAATAAATAANTVASIAADPVGASTQAVTTAGAYVANAVGTAVKGVVEFDPAGPASKKQAPTTEQGAQAAVQYASVSVAVGGSDVAQPPHRKKLATETLARADAWRNTTDEHKAFAKAHWKRARVAAWRRKQAKTTTDVLPPLLDVTEADGVGAAPAPKYVDSRSIDPVAQALETQRLTLEESFGHLNELRKRLKEMETEQIARFRRLNTVLFDLQGEEMNVAMKDTVDLLAANVSETAAKIKDIEAEAVQQGVGYYSDKGRFKIRTRTEYENKLNEAAADAPDATSAERKEDLETKAKEMESMQDKISVVTQDETQMYKKMGDVGQVLDAKFTYDKGTGGLTEESLRRGAGSDGLLGREQAEAVAFDTATERANVNAKNKAWLDKEYKVPHHASADHAGQAVLLDGEMMAAHQARIVTAGQAVNQSGAVQGAVRAEEVELQNKTLETLSDGHWMNWEKDADHDLVLHHDWAHAASLAVITNKEDARTIYEDRMKTSADDGAGRYERVGEMPVHVQQARGRLMASQREFQGKRYAGWDTSAEAKQYRENINEKAPEFKDLVSEILDATEQRLSPEASADMHKIGYTAQLNGLLDENGRFNTTLHSTKDLVDARLSDVRTEELLDHSEHYSMFGMTVDDAVGSDDYDLRGYNENGALREGTWLNAEAKPTGGYHQSAATAESKQVHETVPHRLNYTLGFGDTQAIKASENPLDLAKYMATGFDVTHGSLKQGGTHTLSVATDKFHPEANLSSSKGSLRHLKNLISSTQKIVAHKQRLADADLPSAVSAVATEANATPLDTDTLITSGLKAAEAGKGQLQKIIVSGDAGATHVQVAKMVHGAVEFGTDATNAIVPHLEMDKATTKLEQQAAHLRQQMTLLKDRETRNDGNFTAEEGERFYSQLKAQVGEHYQGDTNGVTHSLEDSLGFNGIALNIKDGHLVTPTRAPNMVAHNLSNGSGPVLMNVAHADARAEIGSSAWHMENAVNFAARQAISLVHGSDMVYHGPDKGRGVIKTLAPYVARADKWLLSKGLDHRRGFFEGWHESSRGGWDHGGTLHEHGHLLRSWNSAVGGYDAAKATWQMKWGTALRRAAEAGVLEPAYWGSNKDGPIRQIAVAVRTGQTFLERARTAVEQPWADGFTKPLPKAVHEKYANALRRATNNTVAGGDILHAAGVSESNSAFAREHLAQNVNMRDYERLPPALQAAMEHVKLEERLRSVHHQTKKAPFGIDPGHSTHNETLIAKAYDVAESGATIAKDGKYEHLRNESEVLSASLTPAQARAKVKERLRELEGTTEDGHIQMLSLADLGGAPDAQSAASLQLDNMTADEWSAHQAAAGVKAQEKIREVDVQRSPGATAKAIIDPTKQRIVGVPNTVQDYYDFVTSDASKTSKAIAHARYTGRQVGWLGAGVAIPWAETKALNYFALSHGISADKLQRFEPVENQLVAVANSQAARTLKAAARMYDMKPVMEAESNAADASQRVANLAHDAGDAADAGQVAEAQATVADAAAEASAEAIEEGSVAASRLLSVSELFDAGERDVDEEAQQRSDPCVERRRRWRHTRCNTSRSSARTSSLSTLTGGR